jgi:hypothetical protein
LGAPLRIESHESFKKGVCNATGGLRSDQSRIEQLRFRAINKNQFRPVGQTPATAQRHDGENQQKAKREYGHSERGSLHERRAVSKRFST